MAPHSPEEKIIDLVDVVEEGEPLESAPAPTGSGIEAELDELFADFDKVNAKASGQTEEADAPIDFDAIFSEDAGTGEQATEKGGAAPEEEADLDFDALFDDDQPVVGKTGGEDAHTAEEDFELGTIFAEETGAQPADEPDLPKEGEQVIELEDIFSDEALSAMPASQSDSLDLDRFFGEDRQAESGSDIPEFDGSVEEIEEFEIDEVQQKDTLDGKPAFSLDEFEQFDLGTDKEEAHADELVEGLADEESSELPDATTEWKSGGEDLSELDALIAGLEGEEQPEEETQEPVLSLDETMIEQKATEEESPVDAVEESDLPQELLDAGFEPARPEPASGSTTNDIDHLMSHIEEEVFSRVETRLAEVTAEWNERERNLLLAIDRLEKENESLRSLIEDRPEPVTREELAAAREELMAQLVIELKRVVPAEAAKVIREEISALMGSLKEE
jgi:pilus assembly protein FimV